MIQQSYQEIDIRAYIQMLKRHKTTIVATIVFCVIAVSLLYPALFDKKGQRVTVESRVRSGNIVESLTYPGQPIPSRITSIAALTLQEENIVEMTRKILEKAQTKLNVQNTENIEIEFMETDGAITTSVTGRERTQTLAIAQIARDVVMDYNKAYLAEEKKRLGEEIEKMKGDTERLRRLLTDNLEQMMDTLAQTKTNQPLAFSIYLNFIQYKIDLEDKIRQREHQLLQLESTRFTEPRAKGKPTVTERRGVPLLILLPFALVFGFFIGCIISGMQEWWRKNKI